MSDPTSLQNRIADALSNATEGRLILRSVVIYESLNERGDRVMSVVQSPDCRAWDILGLTQWGNEAAKVMMAAELRPRD